MNTPRVLFGVVAAAVLVLFTAAPSMAGPPPKVTTGAATEITDTTATLNGTVNPRGRATTARFEWGLTTGYGNNTSDVNVGSGTKNVAVSAPLGGLTSNTTYHFRLRATSSGGTTLGADRTFTVTVGSPPPCSPGTPITISAGGTYSGCYQSTSAGTPAVNITTTAPVTLDRATILHRGVGVRAIDARAALTIQDSTFIASNPGGPIAVGEQGALYAYRPTLLVVENNRFQDGHGLVVNGESLLTDPLQVNRNEFVNVARYNTTGCCPHAIVLDKVLAPGGLIDWNRLIQTYGQSYVEDVIETFETNGASGDPLVISHNLINGSYPYSGDGASHTGSGINLADDGGSWLVADANTCINSANNGIMLGNGDNLVISNNTVVQDGKAGVNDSGSTVSSSFGNGIVAYHYTPGGAAPTNVTVTGNASGHRRWNGSSFEAADYFIPEADVASGNTNISPVDAAAEQAALDAWEAARVTAGVVVGPR